MFRTGRNTGRTGLVPANTGCTGRYLNTGPKCRKAGYVNFDISKGKIVILLNPNSKTLNTTQLFRTALFLSFFLSFSLSCSVPLFSTSLTLSAKWKILGFAVAAFAHSLCPSLAQSAFAHSDLGNSTLSHSQVISLSLSLSLSSIGLFRDYKFLAQYLFFPFCYACIFLFFHMQFFSATKHGLGWTNWV